MKLHQWWLVGLILFVISVVAAINFEISAQFHNKPFLIEYWMALVMIWVALSIIGLGAVCHYLVKLVLLFAFSNIKKLSNNPGLTRAYLTAVAVLGLYPFLLLSAVIIEQFVISEDNNVPLAAHTLNAAIKNTCFVDPLRENCPQTLEEISYIVPEEYRAIMRSSKVQYVFDAENNLYTLVVRRSPTHAVVFDPRLTKSHPFDFKQYSVELIGKDRISNPPAWDGPWEFDTWQYLDARE